MALQSFFYDPNFEKVGSILLSAFLSVRVCVCLFIKIKARVLKFHIWIPCQKIAYPYFLPNYVPLSRNASLRDKNASL